MAEINTAIRNVHGTRCGLYSPQLVFEKFVANQTLNLKETVTACINLVIDELSVAVQTCTQKVSNSMSNDIFEFIDLHYLSLKIIYPSLREFLKNLINDYIGTCETSKDNVLALIDMEMAYMNTNRLEFRY